MSEPQQTLEQSAHFSEDHNLRGYPNALGRDAVDAANSHALALVEGDQASIDARAQETAKAVRRAGILLSILDKDAKPKIDEVLRLDQAPEWLVQASGASEDSTVGQRLMKGDIPEAAALNLLQWHNARLSTRQEQFEQDVLPERISEYRSMVERAVEDGWIPASVLERLGKLETMRTFVDDGLRTTLQGSSGTTDGESIRLSPAHQFRTSTFAHEATHNITGEDTDQDSSDKPWRLRSGMNRVFRTKPRYEGQSLGATIIDEAVTEHIADSLLQGGVDEISPLSPFRSGSSSYMTERQLLDTLCNGGVEPVDIRLFINAYFESGDEREALGDDSAAVKLAIALQDAFPRKDIMFEITYLRQKFKPMMRFINKLMKEGDRGPVGKHGYRNKLKIKDAY